MQQITSLKFETLFWCFISDISLSTNQGLEEQFFNVIVENPHKKQSFSLL